MTVFYTVEVIIIGIDAMNRFNREMLSFFSLIIINIAGAGMSMAISVATGVINLTQLFNGFRFLLPEIVLTGFGLLGFVLSLRWLISSAEILDGFQDIRDEYKKSKEADDEELTSLIIRTVAYYRDNESTFKKLVLASKVTGVFFILNAGAVSVNLLMSMGSHSSTNLLLSLIALAFSLLLGITGVFIPHYFDRYMTIWNLRLQLTSEAEKELDKILEGS